jgi:predicted Zn-dependent protease
MALTPSLGCSGLQNALDTGTALAANVMIPPGEEVKLGLRISSELEKSVKVHENQELQAYIQGLGARMTEKVDVYDPITFKFKVIDANGTINASALPGGHVYIYTGLIMMAETEAELACIIGHEIAHVTQRHIPKRLVAQHGLAELQKAIDEENSVAPLLTNLAADLAGRGYLLSYSRDHELEADEFGIRYAMRAGYNPARFVDFFKRIKAMGSKTPEIFSTHPDPDRRIADVRKIIAGHSEVPDYDGGEGFENAQKILWGADGRPPTP